MKTANTFSYLQTITLVFVVLATFFLPLKTGISNIGLIGLVLTTLLAFITKGINKKNSLFYFLFFSPMVFFIPLLIGIWYTPYLSEAFHEISKYIFLGLTPLFLFRKDINIDIYKRFSIIGLLSGSILSVLILLSITGYHFFQSGLGFSHLLSHEFTGDNFLAPFSDLHPIYVGMYYAMTLAILLFGKFNLSKILRFCAFLFICLGILFLASRIIYVLTFLMICLYLVHYLPFKIFAVLITAGLVVLVLSLPTLQKTDVYKKTVQGTQTELKNKTLLHQTEKVKDTRFSRWQIGWNLVKENPIFGIGGGAENEALLEKYKVFQLEKSIEREYNAHNQFLGFGIRFGILGVLGLLIYFVRNTITAIKKQHLLFLAFLTILFWTFMVENILDRNMGINFVALFGTLFYAEFLFANTQKDE